jgi:hypothetical protein
MFPPSRYQNRICPQILAQLTEISKLLVLDAMIGIRTSVPSLCMCEFSIACHFIYLPKKRYIEFVLILQVANVLKSNQIVEIRHPKFFFLM